VLDADGLNALLDYLDARLKGTACDLSPRLPCDLVTFDSSTERRADTTFDWPATWLRGYVRRARELR
jgi:hypothetical protein